MDDKQMMQLLEALNASPDNVALLTLVSNQYLEQRKFIEAEQILRQYPGELLAHDELSLLTGKILLLKGELAEALTYLHGNSPEAHYEKAKVLLALDRRDEGLEAYKYAVTHNAALENPELASALRVQIRDVKQLRGGPKLRVITNDDTDDEDISRLVEPSQETLQFKDIGGLEEVKKTIHKKIILPYLKPSLFQRFKKRVGGGILLYGPPGCGKTLLARATAGECNAEFINVSIADVLDMYIGESERKLHALFERARQHAPAVLFFDEVEALGGKRQSQRDSHSSKLVSQFLSEMDGFAQNNHGVLILAATNVPWAVDSAFRRPGRFDRVLFVPPPDQPARASILSLLISDRPAATNIDIDFIAKRTSGFSGADLREIVESATDEAIASSIQQGNEQVITMEHLKYALTQVKQTTLEWLTTARNYARYSNEGGQYDDVLAFLKAHGRE